MALSYLQAHAAAFDRRDRGAILRDDGRASERRMNVRAPAATALLTPLRVNRLVTTRILGVQDVVCSPRPVQGPTLDVDPRQVCPRGARLWTR